MVSLHGPPAVINPICPSTHGSGGDSKESAALTSEGSTVAITQRPYQTEAVKAIFAHLVFGALGLDGPVKRTLMIAGTGAGKTIVFILAISRWLIEHPGQRVLILVNTEELIGQTFDKIRFAAPHLAPTLEKAATRADRSQAVVVSTIQTMIRRLGEWAADSFGLIICDEAHLSASNIWQAVLGHYSSAKILGCTATPFRTDKVDLLKFYETICFEYNTFDLIRDGWLCRVKVRTVPLTIDLSELERRTKAKGRPDYDANDVDDALKPYYDAIAQSIVKYAPTRKTLVFLPLIRTSQQFAATLQAHGLSARHVDGKSPDRKEILEAYARNEFRVLCNSNLLTTGYDEPSVDCVLNLRLTKSFVLANQILGRGTRLYPGKDHLLYLDFLYQYDQLVARPKSQIIRPAALVSSNDQEIDEIQGLLSEDGEVDLLEAKSSAAQARQRALARALKIQQKARPGFFDVLDVVNFLGAFEITEYEPLADWERLPPKPGQEACLERAGIDPATIATRGLASVVIKKLCERREKGLCTVPQARSLIRYGHKDALSYSYEKAHALLDKLFGRGRR